jgi:hypothetical protein
VLSPVQDQIQEAQRSVPTGLTDLLDKFKLPDKSFYLISQTSSYKKMNFVFVYTIILWS